MILLPCKFGPLCLGQFFIGAVVVSRLLGMSPVEKHEGGGDSFLSKVPSLCTRPQTSLESLALHCHDAVTMTYGYISVSLLRKTFTFSKLYISASHKKQIQE